MLDRAFLRDLDLTDDQTLLVEDAIEIELKYLDALADAGVRPEALATVLRATLHVDAARFIADGPELARERIQATWGGLAGKCQK